MKHAAISIFAFIGSVASQGCGPATDCATWECHAPNNGDSWCKCFDTTDELTYAATTGCNNDGSDCACGPAAPQCAAVTTSAGECGMGHGSLPCPTATAPSAWCNNPAHPGRLTVPWCMETFCDQCIYGFAKILGGCDQTNVPWMPVDSPGCQACGLASRGPCQPGVLTNDAKCHPTNGPGGARLSLRGETGCSADYCMFCGGFNAKPCNNGDGLRICDADFGPYKCVARAPLCRRSLLCLILRRLLAPTNDAGSRDCFLLTSRSRAPLRRSAFRRPASSSAGIRFSSTLSSTVETACRPF